MPDTVVACPSALTDLVTRRCTFIVFLPISTIGKGGVSQFVVAWEPTLP